MKNKFTSCCHFKYKDNIDLKNYKSLFFDLDKVEIIYPLEDNYNIDPNYKPIIYTRFNKDDIKNLHFRDFIFLELSRIDKYPIFRNKTKIEIKQERQYKIKNLLKNE